MRRFITKKFGEELKAQTLGMGPEYSSHKNAEQTVSPVGVFSDQGPGQSTLQWHSAPFPPTQCVISGLMFTVAMVAGVELICSLKNTDFLPQRMT